MGSPIQDKAEDAVSFLYDRYHYWNRLGPLPPPPPLQKSRASRFSGSSLSVDTLGTARTGDSKTTWKSGDSGMSWKTKTIKSRLGLNKPDKGTKPKPDPTSLEFKFETHNPSMDLGTRRMTEIAEENEDLTDSKQTEEETKSISHAVTDYLRKELDVILSLYAQRKFADTVKKCESGLDLLAKYSEANVPEKSELTGLFNSYLGNVAVQAGDFTRALKHHTIDLKIGEKCDVMACRYRALGNLGRTHMLQGKYNRALEMYTMKAPLCKTAGESSALFHDIGNCFLLLNNFSYARDAGRKSLETGQESDDKRLQLQACVLIGLSEVNMKKYKDAYNSFETGLTHAQALGDKQAEEAMNHALIDINKKLANKSKKSQAESRDTYPPSSHASDSARSVMVEG
ncbi:tetratricopeptide repeat protein 25-like [Mizuhopecten yessoensis]|nr:tetratricopeptide repeat protein 25-like [Mizuhopecten yessoensis]